MRIFNRNHARVLSLLAAILIGSSSILPVTAYAESEGSGEYQDSGFIDSSDSSKKTGLTSGASNKAASPEQVTQEGGTGYSNMTLQVTGSGSGGDNGGGDNPVDPDDPSGGGGSGDTDVIIATVPVELPIVMNLEGAITVPTTAKIVNNTADKGIEVQSISISLESPWVAAAYADDFSTKAADTKELGLKLRGDELETDGTFTPTSGNWKIAKGGDLPLNMKVKLPMQTKEEKIKLATIGFTIGWSGDDTSSGGSDPDAGKTDDPTPPVKDTYTVTFTAEGPGRLEGDTQVEVPKESTLKFPTPVPQSTRYTFEKWLDDKNTEIDTNVKVVSDMTIKGVFDDAPASPKNWFKASGNTLTGLSDEYLNMIDAPTELVIPNNIGGSSITTIAANAFTGKDLLRDLVLPETITTIGADAFSGCSSELMVNMDTIPLRQVSGFPWGLNSNDQIIWGAPADWDTNPMTEDELWNLNLRVSAVPATENLLIAVTDNTKGRIELPTSVDGKKIIRFDGLAMYMSNDKLTELIVPGTYTTVKTSNLEGLKILDARACPASVSLEVLAPNLTDVYFPPVWQGSINGMYDTSVTTLHFHPDDKIHKIIDGGVYTVRTDGSLGVTLLPPLRDTYVIPEGVTAYTHSESLRAYKNIVGPSTLETVSFTDAPSLLSIDLSANKSGISYKKQTFYNLPALEDLRLSGKSNYFSQVNAIDKCPKLTTVDIPGKLLLSTSMYPKTIFNATGVKTINIAMDEDAVEGAPWGATGATVNWLGADNSSGLTPYPEEPVETVGMTTDEAAALGIEIVEPTVVRLNTAAKDNLVLPTTIEGNAIVELRAATEVNSVLKGLEIPDTYTKVDTTNLQQLQTLRLPKSLTDGTIVGSMLRTVYLPATWGAGIFKPASISTGVEYVLHKDDTTHKLLNVGVMDKGNSSISILKNGSGTLIVPNGVKSFFASGMRYSKVVLPATQYEFPYLQNMPNLTEIDASKVTSTSMALKSSTYFNGSSKLAKFKLPPNLTGIISAQVFAQTPELVTLDIPASVTSIRADAFLNSGIKTLNISKAEGSISGRPWGLTDATINWLG